MKMHYLFLLIILTSCTLKNPAYETLKAYETVKEMTLTMDLSTVELSKSINITPATFETVTEQVVLVDKVVKDGYYTSKTHRYLFKDSYSTIRAIPNAGRITFRNETLISYAGHEAVTMEPQYKEYTTYKYCKDCGKSNGVSYKEVKGNFRTSSKESEAYKKTFSRYRLVNDAIAQASYKNGSQHISVSGTEAELKKLLKHKMLKGVKHKMK